jgi:outer membrane protein OmpA-like peptidoglycan-associated protein
MNLIQTVLGLLTPQLISKIAGMIGESPEATTKTMGGVLPAILGSLIQKGGNAQGAGALIDLMKNNKVDAGLLDNLSDILGGGEKTAGLQQTGGNLVAALIGDKLGPIGNLLGAFGGVKANSAQSLMGLAAPLVLGAVAKHLPGGLDPTKLIGLLDGQKEHVAKALPPGLGALMGFAAPTMAAAAPTPPATPRVVPPAPPAQEEKKGGGVLPWILGAAALGAIALIGPRTCAQTDNAAVVEQVKDLAGKLSLPGGVELQVPPGSIGEQLFRFLSGNETAPKNFVFDNLTFQTGSANLTPESKATVDAITAILKAYPNVNATIEGYTDSQGSAAKNKQLSEQRAKTVADAMIAAGVDGARLVTAGHGADKPIADNATPEGREKNRRIELTVTKK